MATQRPNVLFVFADQMRGMDMGCAGNGEVRTPNMDRLAGEGTRFTRAFANCPVCTPSRAILLTSRYPLSNLVIANDLPLPEDMPTIGAAFRDAGYRTGYIGKWHLDGVPRVKWTPPGPRRHGFDYWAGSYSTSTMGTAQQAACFSRLCERSPAIYGRVSVRIPSRLSYRPPAGRQPCRQHDSDLHLRPRRSALVAGDHDEATALRGIGAHSLAGALAGAHSIRSGE